MGVEAHSKQRKQPAKQAAELAWTAQITEMASALQMLDLRWESHMAVPETRILVSWTALKLIKTG